MTRHVCEWEPFHEYLVWCPKCKKPPKAADVVRALNATKRLSAADALFVQTLIPEQFVEQILALRAYADIQEQTCTPDGE